MAESFNAGVTKVKISNCSSTITMSAVNYNHNQQFVFTNEGGLLLKYCFLQTFTTPTLSNILK